MQPKGMLIVSMLTGAVAVGILVLQARRTQGDAVTVFRATRDAAPGEVLQGGFEPVAMPGTAYAPMKAQLPTSELEAWVSSTKLVRPIHAGDVVTFDYFLKSADEGVPARIKPGMRAVALEVRGAQAVGYLIRPGDYVDVMATLAKERTLVTQFQLQAKKVLAVDQQYRLEDSAFPASRSYSTVTLEVTPEEAQKIEFLRSVVRGGFALALRNKDDKAVVQTQDYTVPSLAFEGLGNR